MTTATLVSLIISPASANPQLGYGAAVDNLTLGTAKAAATVPEPATDALVLAAVGAALVTGRSRRRGR